MRLNTGRNYLINRKHMKLELMNYAKRIKAQIISSKSWLKKRLK